MVEIKVKHYEVIKDNTGEQFILLDNTDIKIIEMLKENPFMLQNDIAEKLKLSQPVISMKIKGLAKILTLSLKYKYILAN